MGLVESTPLLAERYQLQGATALVKIADDQTLPFRLINPTGKPVTLYWGGTLGTFSEADGDFDFPPVGKSDNNQLDQPTEDSVPVDFSTVPLTWFQDFGR